MAILTEQNAKQLLKKVLSYSKAEECQVSLTGNLSGNIRYARNTVTTAGETSDVTLAVTSAFGKKSGVSTINEFDDASIKKAVRRSEELAKLSPENPEYMPNIGPQKYQPAKNFAQSTANTGPQYRAEAAHASIEPSRKKQLVSSGFLNDQSGFIAIMNKKGLFAYNKSSSVNFSVTIKTEDGKGSGWVSREHIDINKLDTKVLSGVAIDKAINSAAAKAMEPGKYTVILEPDAGVQLLLNMVNAMGQRGADEGRSFMSYKGKEDEKNPPKNKLGQKMFDQRVNIYSDPYHPEAATPPFDNNGYSVKRTDWVKNGKVVNLFNSAYWATKSNSKHVPIVRVGNLQPQPRIVMEGGNQSLEEMIANTRRGVLITRLWYIRALDPQTLMYTGLTRDGTFYIENGKIKHPIKNFRFNESPIVMLNNIEALGKAVVTSGGNVIPPMKIRDFTFSSTSDAV